LRERETLNIAERKQLLLGLTGEARTKAHRTLDVACRSTSPKTASVGGVGVTSMPFVSSPAGQRSSAPTRVRHFMN
jgi:hypothetical protein